MTTHIDWAAEARRAKNWRPPEQRRAQRLVAKAVEEGRLAKPFRRLVYDPKDGYPPVVLFSCQHCHRATLKIHAHHEDYSKPLDVLWVCPSCHAEIHAADRREFLEQTHGIESNGYFLGEDDVFMWGYEFRTWRDKDLSW